MASQKVIISVLADTTRFTKAFKNLSKQTGLSKLTSGFKNLGSKITGAFSTGVKAVTAFGLAMAGLALKGGFERMLKIEDAEAKLKGLGHSAGTITTIMDSALASVKGTAAGLDDAATMAATAVAAGIKPGKDLTAALSLVNDASTIAGTGLNDMGAIFSKVWTSGRAQTQELNQIADRGLPIWTKLAEHYNVSADELRSMVSKGKVDSATFAQVMDEMVGGAALKAGDTTRGAFANMKAALSRTGVAILDQVFPLFRKAFAGITTWLDTLTDRLKPVGEAFNQWVTKTALPAIQRFGNWISQSLMPALKGLWDTISKAGKTAFETIGKAFKTGGDDTRSFGDVITSVITTITPIIGAIITRIGDLIAAIIRHKDVIIPLVLAVTGAVVAFNAFHKALQIAKAFSVFISAAKALWAVMLANPIGLIITAIAALVAGLVYFFTQTEKGREIWETVWGAIQTAAAAVVAWWTGTALPAITAVWEKIKEIATSVADWFQEHVAPVFQAAGEAIRTIFTKVGEGGQLMREKLDPVFQVISNAWGKLWEGVQAVWEKIGPPIISYVKTQFENLKTTVTNAWNTIRTTVETVMAVIKGVIKTVTNVIKGDWQGAWDSIKETAATVWTNIKNIVANTIGALKTVIGNNIANIKDTWAKTWNNVKTTITNAFTSIKTGVTDRLKSLLGSVKKIPNDIKNAFLNFPTLLKNLGGQLLQGLWNGISAKTQWLKNKITGIGGKITGWVKGIFGIKSPSRVWRDQIGDQLISGLALGLGDIKPVTKQLNTLARTINGTDLALTPRIEAATATGYPAHSAAGATLPPITINLHTLNPTLETGRMIAESLGLYTKVNGHRQ